MQVTAPFLRNGVIWPRIITYAIYTSCVSISGNKRVMSDVIVRYYSFQCELKVTHLMMVTRVLLVRQLKSGIVNYLTERI